MSPESSHYHSNKSKRREKSRYQYQASKGHRIPVTTDVTVLGAGAAGLALTWWLIHEQNYMGQITIVDDSFKKSPSEEKIWCFWEQGVLPWEIETLVEVSWMKMKVGNGSQYTEHQFKENVYRCIRSSHYRRHLISTLSSFPNVSFIEDRYLDHNYRKSGGSEETVAQITCEEHDIFSPILVSSLEIPFKKKFESTRLNETGQPAIWQQFQGWEIETNQPVFEPGTFTFMDFDPDNQDGIGFTYVLPFTSHKALVEWTKLSTKQVPADTMAAKLKQYLNKRFGIERGAYHLNRVESGAIPMDSSRYKARSFHENASFGGGVIPIGQAAGTTRPSTGYTFIRTWQHARQIAAHIAEPGKTQLPDKQLDGIRHRFFDEIFLRELNQNPGKVKKLLWGLLTTKNSDRIFDFLSGQSSLLSELSLLTRMPILHFSKSALNYFRSKK